MKHSKLMEPGKWYIEFNESGERTAYVYEDSAIRLLGYASREEYENAHVTWDEAIHPDDLEELNLYIADIESKHPEGMEYDAEYRIMTKNGYHWIHDCGHVERRTDGSPVRIDGAAYDIQDIHEKQDLAKQLEESLAFTNFFLNTFVSAYFIDLDTCACQVYTRTKELEMDYPVIDNYFEGLTKYIDRDVHPDDRAQLAAVMAPESLRKKLREVSDFTHLFRDISGNTEKYYRVQIIRSADEHHAALGFVDVTEDFREQQKRLLGAIPLSSDVLTKANIGLWSFELDEGSEPRMYADEAMLGLIGLTDRVSPEETYHAWYDHIDENAYGLVSDAVEKMTAGEHAEVQYPWHHPNGETWIVRCGGVRNFEYKTGIRIEGTHQNVTEILHFDEREHAESIARRDREIISVLASEYSSVYYIDLATDGLTPYTMNEETETTFGSVFRSGITYSEAYKLYVDKLIFNADRRMMLKAGSLENIRRELANKKTFLTQYRSADNKYSEMKFVKVGGENDEPLAVALGFAEKDDEIRREQQIAEERRRNTDIIEILASEYSSVYYIDLTTDELNPYTMNEETETEFGKIFRSGIRYSDAYRLYVDTLIHSEDKQMMLKAGSLGNIMKELRNKKTFLTTYRNAEGHYSEMKFVKVGNEDGVPKAVALGFADKDEEIRAREEESRIRQRNIDIIEILASEYSSVYYIDLTRDELDPYTMNEATETEFGKIFRSGIKYSDAYKMYVDTLVHPEDKERMLQAGSIYNILKELGDKKSFITQYMDNEGAYSEMKFVKVGNDENPEAVALGFANRDREIREEIARKEADARDRAVISGLSDDFGCVIYVGLNDDSEIQYRFDPLFEKHIPNWSAISDFRERLKTLISTVMHPDDRQEFREATRKDVVRENINRDGVYFVNFRTLIDGEVTYYQAKFVRDENSEDHVIAGFHNVDETTKREMDALDKAEVASRAKSSFLFNMSHDIRTPMNAITGFTAMAKKHLDDKEKIADYLNKIETAGNQLLALINQVLEMSRIESGKVVLSEQKTDIAERAEILRTLYSEQALANGIRFAVTVKNVRHPRVITDADRMKQITTNILGNALKYTPEGGSVDYCIEEKECDRPGYGTYVITVSDTGIGMSKEYLEHIFDEFSRENTSTVSRIQGTGLGMSIVKQLTDLLGGTIDIQSEKGKGTTISVSVPMQWDTEPEAADGKENEGNHVSLEGVKILLVDDNEMNREIAEEILSENGMIIETAEDGDVAVDKVRKALPGQYDLILMDVQMPRMNGYEATRAIRALSDPVKSQIPIVAMTANAFVEDRQNAFAAGMNDHLAKPIDIGKVVNTLAKFVSRP